MKLILATSKVWKKTLAKNLRRKLGCPVITMTRKETLTLNAVKKINPRYIFFPHWSYKISPDIYENYECVIFHMTDLPFGRGGSPLQNLISRGIYRTKITAFRAAAGMDAGKIYLKRNLSLADGGAQGIYEKATDIIEEMIFDIVRKQPVTVRQRGRPVVFKRRTPDQSDLRRTVSLRSAYDMIRMLDAAGYPHAFLDTDKLRLEFTQAERSRDSVDARVKITLRKTA